MCKKTIRSLIISELTPPQSIRVLRWVVENEDPVQFNSSIVEDLVVSCTSLGQEAVPSCFKVIFTGFFVFLHLRGVCSEQTPSSNSLIVENRAFSDTAHPKPERHSH